SQRGFQSRGRKDSRVVRYAAGHENPSPAGFRSAAGHENPAPTGFRASHQIRSLWSAPGGRMTPTSNLPSPARGGTGGEVAAWPVVGHEAAVELLQRALSSGHPAHAYLLTGPPQAGKATLAHLFP